MHKAPYLIQWREFNKGSETQYENCYSIREVLRFLADNQPRIVSYRIYKELD